MSKSPIIIESIDEENFESNITKRNKLVIADFYAEWCGPCKMLTPILESICKKYENIVDIFKINVETNNIIANKYSIKTVPTIIMFKKNEIIYRHSGFMSEQNISKLINKHS